MSTLFLRTLREDPADAEVRQPPPAGAGRLHPPGRARWVHVAAARLDRLPQRRADRPRGDGRAPASRRCTSRRCCPASRTRRRAAGPTTATTCSASRTAAATTILLAPDARGDVHAAREGPVLVVQGPAARASTRSRRSTATRPGPRAGLLRGREFVMKDSYSFDVDDAGLAASLPAPPRRLHQRTFDRLGLPYVIVSAMSGAMGGSASEEFLAPIDVGEDTYVRCTELRLRRQHRGGARRRPRRRSRSTGCRRAVVARHARHADDPDAGRPPQRPRRPAPRATATVDGGRHAEERRRQAAPPRRHAASRWRSACPATARSTSSGSRRRSRPPRSSRSPRPTSPANPTLAKGYIGPGRARRRTGQRASASSSTRGSSTARAWVTGADAAGPPRDRPRRRARLHAPTASIEAAEVRRRRPVPELRQRRSRSPAASRSATSSSSAASTPTALGLTVLDQNGKHRSRSRWARTASACHRAVAAIAEMTLRRRRAVLATRGRPGRRPHRRSPARPATEQCPAAERWPPSCEAAGVRVLLDDRDRRVARRQVQGRRADRRADDRRRRPRAGRRRRRGQGPGTGERRRRRGRRRASTSCQRSSADSNASGAPIRPVREPRGRAPSPWPSPASTTRAADDGDRNVRHQRRASAAATATGQLRRRSASPLTRSPTMRRSSARPSEVAGDGQGDGQRRPCGRPHGRRHRAPPAARCRPAPIAASEANTTMWP